MKILIAGGTGFIGRHLVEAWRGKHELFVIGRNPQKIKKSFGNKVHAIAWKDLEDWHPSNFDALINLAGESIQRRWTRSAKHNILNSRIKATEKLATWCAEDSKQKIHFLSASALSIYGLYDHLLHDPNTETTPIHHHKEFLSKVAYDWEAAAQQAVRQGIPTTWMRFAVVFDKKEGAFPKLLKAIRSGWGKMGSGQQPLMWISIHDLVQAIDFILHKKITGPINLVAPQRLSQAQVSKLITQHLKKSAKMKIPSVVLRLLLGQMATEMLLKGQDAYPRALIMHGFHFSQPNLSKALQGMGV